MANFHRYFFIMPTLARFELEMHERVERGEGLTAELLDELMADLFAEATAPTWRSTASASASPGRSSRHLYAQFYVYQYATGISGAHALAAASSRATPAPPSATSSFLRAGGSLYPLDILRAPASTSPRPSRSSRRSPCSPRSSTGSKALVP